MFDSIQSFFTPSDSYPVPSEYRDDPVARRTEWHPLKSGGANFVTHRLVRSGDKYLFKPTVGALLFYSVFFLAGVGMLYFFDFPTAPGDFAQMDEDDYVLLLMGVIFTSGGGYMMRTGSRPIVFDRRRGYYYLGTDSPDEYLDKSQLKDFVRLEKIHALQLVREYVRTKNSSYYSYELNLVLKDGARINIVDHNGADKLQEEARILAEYLGVALWRGDQ